MTLSVASTKGLSNLSHSFVSHLRFCVSYPNDAGFQMKNLVLKYILAAVNP